MTSKNLKKALAGMAVMVLGGLALTAGTVNAHADSTTNTQSTVLNIPAAPVSKTEVNVRPADSVSIKNVPAAPISKTEINVRPASAETQSSQAVNNQSSVAQQNVNNTVSTNHQTTDVTAPAAISVATKSQATVSANAASQASLQLASTQGNNCQVDDQSNTVVVAVNQPSSAVSQTTSIQLPSINDQLSRSASAVNVPAAAQSTSSSLNRINVLMYLGKDKRKF